MTVTVSEIALSSTEALVFDSSTVNQDGYLGGTFDLFSDAAGAASGFCLGPTGVAFLASGAIAAGSGYTPPRTLRADEDIYGICTGAETINVYVIRYS